MNDTPPSDAPFKLVWSDVEGMTAVHSDHLVVAARDGYFLVTFGQTVDPIVLREEDAEALKSRGYVSVKPLIRMAIPPLAMARMASAFIENLKANAPHLLAVTDTEAPE